MTFFCIFPVPFIEVSKKPRIFSEPQAELDYKIIIGIVCMVMIIANYYCCKIKNIKNPRIVKNGIIYGPQPACFYSSTECRHPEIINMHKCPKCYCICCDAHYHHDHIVKTTYYTSCKVCGVKINDNASYCSHHFKRTNTVVNGKIIYYHGGSEI